MNDNNEPTLELSRIEKLFIAMAQEKHKGCQLETCTIHTLINSFMKVDAARERLEHDLQATEENEMGTHGVNSKCIQCDWTPKQWLDFTAEQWGKE